MHQRPRTVKLYFMDFTVRRFDTYLCFFLHKNSALIPPEQYPFKVSVSTIPTCNIYTFFYWGNLQTQSYQCSAETLNSSIYLPDQTEEGTSLLHVSTFRHTAANQMLLLYTTTHSITVYLCYF